MEINLIHSLLFLAPKFCAPPVIRLHKPQGCLIIMEPLLMATWTSGAGAEEGDGMEISFPADANTWLNKLGQSPTISRACVCACVPVCVHVHARHAVRTRR